MSFKFQEGGGGGMELLDNVSAIVRGSWDVVSTKPTLNVLAYPAPSFMHWGVTMQTQCRVSNHHFL